MTAVWPKLAFRRTGWLLATLFAVLLVQFATGTTAQAAEPGSISGTVTSAATKQPIAGIEACAYETTPPYSEVCSKTSESGGYTIMELPVGSYEVYFSAPSGSGLNYIGQGYPKSVSVTAGAITPGIDAAMAAGAEVTGTVIGKDTKSAIEGIEVCAYQAEEEYEGFYAACAVTDASGDYTIAGLASGEYKLQFFEPDGSGLNYLSQYYDGKGSLAEADVLQLTAGATTSGIDAALATGGEVSGRVTSAGTKAAVAGIDVCAYAIEGAGSGCARTDASGAYSVAGLPTGTYQVRFEAPYEGTLNYVTQYYDGKTYSDADPVPVTVGITTPNIDAALQSGGEITGTVTGAKSKAGLEHVYVCASGPEDRCASTGPSGEYAITSLPSGSYTVSFNGTAEYTQQYYNGKTSYSGADPVAVTAESTSPGIDAELQPGGTISGTVTSADTAPPLEGIRVCGYPVEEEYYGVCTYTNAHGEYSLTDLPATEYKVEFSSYTGNYLTQYYDGKASKAEADPVSVAVGEAKSGIDAALQTGGEITGTVTDGASKLPVTGATVTAYMTSGSSVTSATTNAKGEYALERLTGGSYKVGFNATEQNLVPQYFEDKGALYEAGAVSVTTGSTTPGINAALQAGGGLSGTISNATTKAPLASASVSIQASSGSYVAIGYTNAKGQYSVKGLAEGSYKVYFNAYGFESQYYNGRKNLAEADLVSVTAGAVVTGIDAAMRSLGSIAGTVTDAGTHSTVDGVEVCAYNQSETYYAPCVSTGPGGNYTIGGLPTGTYKVGFFASGEYLAQYYDDKESIEKADTIDVGNEPVTGIDAALQLAGHVKGKVTGKTSGEPLSEIEVCADAISGNYLGGCATTASDGSYDIGGLATGSYRVEFVPETGTSNYLSQYYDGKSKSSEADAVAVTAGAATEEIGAALVEGGQITGRITSIGAKTPLAHAGACAYAPEGEAYRCGYTNSEGEYTINGLPSGKYVVYFYPTEGAYAYQYYKEATKEAEATLVDVSTGATAKGIDGQLPASGRITGRVTSAASAKPLSGIEVCALSSEGAIQSCTSSGTSGEYVLAGLSAGKHKVEFRSGSQSYETQYYNAKASLEEADLVEVGESATTGEIDAAMVSPDEITGRVTKEDGTTGLAGIQVCAFATSSPYTDRCGTTGSSGEYQLTNVPSGSYKVQFYAPTGLNYIEEYYPGKASEEEGETIAATPGAVTEHVDASMKVGGEITGKVTATESGNTIAGIQVCPSAVTFTGYYAGCMTTDASGEYTIEKLPTGEYRVGFEDPFNSSLNFVRQYYHDRAHFSEADKLAITAGTMTSGIDAALEPGGEVSGKVIRIGTKAPLQSITVCPLEHGGYEEPAPCAQTNASGEYTLRGLPPGLVDVEFAPGNYEYFTQYYKETDHRGGATGVPVEVLHDTTDINAALKSTHPIVPELLLPPTISGTAQQGASLTEHHGEWTHEPTEYRYQWFSCNSLGLSCLPIEHADGQSYTPLAKDVGSTLEVRETAINVEGESESAMSEPTVVVVPAKPVNQSPPEISGEARAGKSLGEHHGSWTNEPTEYAYGWERCNESGAHCEAVGADEASYALSSADVGHTIRVIETAINAGGESEPATSQPSAVVVPEVPITTAPPSITGTATQGHTLTEHHGTWSNAPTSYTYQWWRCSATGKECGEIPGATYASYLLTSADVGHAITVTETASNAGGASKATASAPTSEVQGAIPVALSGPTIQGDLNVGQTLTEHHGNWTNEPDSFTYQWFRCSTSGEECHEILGATEASYTLEVLDQDHEIAVEEVAANPTGAGVGAASQPTEAVAGEVPEAPEDITPPTITGSPQQGETLHEQHGEWSNEPTTYEIEWQRCDTAGENCATVAGGAEDTSYQLDQDDLGHTIRAIETASNKGGPGTPIASLPTGRVVAAAPSNITPPTIAGHAVLNETLAEAHGSWSNQPSSYEVQWLRCPSGSGTCTPINGADQPTYRPSSADVGEQIEVQETALNAGGSSEPAYSAKTETVLAEPLRADAGEDLETVAGTTVTFDGSGSTPTSEITSYHWDFGDGTDGSGEIVQHAYKVVGQYTATLTVERRGETSRQSITVTVVAPGPTTTITVRDEDNQPVAGADILYIGPANARTEATTDDSGQAELYNLPDGSDAVYVYKEGYKPLTALVSVSSGTGEAAVTLTAGALGEAKLETHEMNKKEIEEAGINLNDPANQNVYEFEYHGAFTCHINSAGEFVGLEHCTGGGGGGGGEDWTPHGTCIGNTCISGGSIEKHPFINELVLQGKLTTLKQFFAVKLVVHNLSPEPFKFTHGSATLTVPGGMSLAPTPTPQSDTQSVADISGEGSVATNWIIRGDRPGEYYLSASYHGQLEPFEKQFELEAGTAEPLKVWGAEAFGFRVQADEGSVTEGVPYHVKIGIYDKAPIPFYNVAIAINSALHEHFIFQPDQAFETSIGELKPGETIYAPQDILVPNANGGKFDPSESYARFVGEQAHPGEGIEAVKPPPLYTMSASLESITLIHLHWQPSPGAEGYEIFSTPSLDTAFGATPDAGQTSPTNKTTVTRLPASATDAWIPRGANDPPRYYAISTVIGGQLRLEHPVKEPALQGPVGGPLTLRELLAGGHNLSEFCVACFISGHESFGQPVDAPTGNFWHSFTDLNIPGRGIPLNLTRTYNSGAASSKGPFGYGWSFPYGMNLAFPDTTHVIVNQENGSAVEFSEEAGGKWAAPPRVTATLTHNGNGSWSFVRRKRETFSFDRDGRLAAQTDLDGYTTSLAYNAKGQLKTVTDPAGRKLKFVWKKGHIASVTDPLKRHVNYGYDSAGNLTDVTDVAGGDTHFTYDSQHRMLSMRMPNQAPGVPGSTEAALHNTYDEQGRVISQTDSLGRKTTFEYAGEPLGEAGGATVITDPKGSAVRQTYQWGELTSETRGYGTPEAATWKFEYDQETLGVTTVTDPNGHLTKSTYDAEGNVLSTEDALGRKTVNTYDALNDELTSTDPLGVTTTMTYDSHGNLMKRSRPLLGTPEVEAITYTYGDSSHPGDVTAMTDPDGHTWRYGYDKYGDRTTSTDPLGDTTTSTCNADGWKLTEVNPRGNASGKPSAYTTTYSYNSFGQVTKTTDPLGHSTTSEYDPDGNQIASTDANGHTTRYSYDADDEQVAEHLANGTTTETTYWPDGSIKGQIDGAGHATKYGYDALGRRNSVTDPLGRTTHYAYDAAGNETSTTDPEGNVTTMTYDAADQQTSISYSDGKTPNVTGITYDADGQRVAETDGSGAWAWHWDSLHRLTSVIEGSNGTVSYRYDLRGLPTSITYPNGKTVSRTYDAAGRLTTTTDWKHYITQFAYDTDGDVIRQTGGGVTDTYVFDHADAMKETSDKAGSATLFSAKYARNAESQVTSDSSATSGQGNYGYTALDQLCYAGSTSSESCTSPPAGSSSYAYDKGNNVTQLGATAQAFDAAGELCWTATGTSGGNCETAPSGATTYSYNERGDRTVVKPSSGPSTLLSYDQADRLTHYARGTTTASYLYNSDGLRMVSTIGKTKTAFGWDVAEELPLLLQAGKTSYIYGPEGLPIEQFTKPKPEWLHHDQLGSTRLITSSSGASVGGYTYGPWGAVVSHTGSASTSLGYTGQYTDAESGYQYLRARYYDPATGQFISVDPAASTTLSRYGYANDTPVTTVDPTGLSSWTICAGPLCVGHDSSAGWQVGFGFLSSGDSKNSKGDDDKETKGKGKITSLSIQWTDSNGQTHGFATPGCGATLNTTQNSLNVGCQACAYWCVGASKNIKGDAPPSSSTCPGTYLDPATGTYSTPELPNGYIDPKTGTYDLPSGPSSGAQLFGGSPP
jgi:RHS repeat-associated protein